MIELQPGDFYLENGLMVFTEQYHLRRGTCCGSGCRHCPWTPKAKAARMTTVAAADGDPGGRIKDVR